VSDDDSSRDVLQVANVYNTSSISE